MKSVRFLHSAALVSVVIALAGCQQQKAADSKETSGAETAAAAGPEAPAGLSVSDGMLVLPAVKGRPGVAYFALTNGSDKPTSLAAISVDGAGKAEMHETKGDKMEPMNWLQVDPGKTVRFERGGKHVMVFDLADKVAAGGTAEMTLTFSGGDKLSTPLRVEAAGGAH